MKLLNEIITALSISASAATPNVETNSDWNIIPYEPNHVEIQCLAENIYHEAKNQGTAGWSGVASVTLNRVEDSRFPNTICEVVKQGPTRESWKTRGKNVPESERKYYPIKHRCQFSWYCDGKADTISKHDTEIFDKIYNLSRIILNPNIILLDITDGATHYHADYVFPEWRKTKTKTVEIGDHIFYRWEK